MRLHLNGRSYDWDFTLADVRFPLLGADFLSHHELLVDVAGRRLIDSQSLQVNSPQLAITSAAADYVGVVGDAFADLFHRYADVFKPELRQIPGRSPKHGIWYHMRPRDGLLIRNSVG